MVRIVKTTGLGVIEKIPVPILEVLAVLPEAALAGGALRDLYRGAKVNDWDIFVHANSWGWAYHEIRAKYDNTTTPNGNSPIMELILPTGEKVQINGLYPSVRPGHLLPEFDFDVNMIAYWEGSLYAEKDYEDPFGDTTVINFIKYKQSIKKLCERLEKMQRKGFVISEKALMQFAEAARGKRPERGSWDTWRTDALGDKYN